MRISARFRTLLVCAMLEYAAMMGSPMRPEEIAALMHQMSQPKLGHVLRDDDKSGTGDSEPPHEPPTTSHQPR